MTIQQLTYFLATVEHGSFSGAARSLFLTQPSISEQVRQLEGELGIALFARAGRGLVLTEAGRRFRPEAERVLADVERARDAVAEVRDLRGGTLGFGMFGTASAYLIADLAADFRRKYPDVRLRLVGLNSSEVADQVRNATLEAGLVVLPVDDAGLDLRVARLEELVVVSREAARAERPGDDRGARRRAADPLRRPVRRRRPDATPAARPRPARRRDAAARDRGRGHRSRRRSRAPRTRRHDRPARGDQPPGRARPALRVVRRAALRHVRLHRAFGRAALACGPRVRRDRRAPARAPVRSGPVRRGHVRGAADVSCLGNLT